MQKVCDEDIQDSVIQCRRRNELIMKRLINVFSKFEELLCQERGRNVLRAEHETLNEYYSNILNQINDPQFGIVSRLRRL